MLNGIDFSVNVGEFVSIVGPSGSGKTTLLNCLSGLEEIDSGSVALDGNLISSMNTIERRSQKAFGQFRISEFKSHSIAECRR